MAKKPCKLGQLKNVNVLMGGPLGRVVSLEPLKTAWSPPLDRCHMDGNRAAIKQPLRVSVPPPRLEGAACIYGKQVAQICQGLFARSGVFFLGCLTKKFCTPHFE